MDQTSSVVVTSIAPPNPVLRSIAAGCQRLGVSFYVVGDMSSPPDFDLGGCDFYSIHRQQSTDLRYAAVCPTRHYARKNIGYLLAIRNGAELLVETDDDNYPLDGFWDKRVRRRRVPLVKGTGFVNAYRYFTEAMIWPRGLPLDVARVNGSQPTVPAVAGIDAPIQQGLADDNPDVDAVYRLLLPLPLKFAAGRSIALSKRAWCPFNSQNTTWWPDAYPLLYLPACCSFRMTDIWRSFIAQRIAWENEWRIIFDSPTVSQDRNEHDLMRDFADEIPGYLHNRALCEKLEALPLAQGVEHIPDNLRICYQELVKNNWLDRQELGLLEAWLQDVKAGA